MELANVSAVMESVPKGANIVLEWTRDAKVRKGAPNVKKAVRMVGRLGVEYDNLAAVQEKRSNGELPAENQSETWWTWERHPFLVRHKTTGQRYLRLYKGTSTKVRPSVQYLCEGKAVSFEAIEAHLLASEKGSHDNTDTFMVKIEDLTRIYSETAEYGSLFPNG